MVVKKKLLKITIKIKGQYKKDNKDILKERQEIKIRI